MIQISVNNNIQKIEANITLASFLEKLLPNQNGIAIALNEQVVPQSNWQVQKLVENDQILIITATQGG
ncbi:thiamine biosynthesis protein ThiS [Putridiphycobacter roseus]|uniref:Thiamine biosynthesis protein ThiS n=1 Tax=Putridiphycobacter roseus TaxID=2219161 RepID=A0A2W1MWS4_9FLAO|nr:sulfur carrier protein ThiS [Putridiphycobacter roseus]PZE16327.1 thiamine biosynthesis protein ThiS [Putridiphycobacter roseus]